MAADIAAADIAAAGTVAESGRSQERYLQIGLGEVIRGIRFLS